MTLNRFTDDTLKGLPPHVYDNHYGQDFVQVPVTDTEGKGTRTLKPFSHEFDFQAEGVTVTPVKVSDVERAKKNTGLRLLTMFSTPAAPNLSRAELPHKGVIATGEQNTIQNLYPGATVEKTGNIWVVIQQKQTDVYNKVTALLSDEGREMLEARSLLSPRVREILKEYGEIIYESNPEGADRVIVCFPTVHGRPDSALQLQAFIPNGGELFIAHQLRIRDAVSDSLAALDESKTHLFLESFPDPDIDSKQEETFKKVIWNEAVFKGQLERMSQASPELAEYLQYIRFGRSFMMDIYNQTTGLRLHGDNREKYVGNMNEQASQFIFGNAFAKAFTDTAGVVSAIHEQKQELDQAQMYGSQGGVTTQVAKHLSAGETAFLVYGAGHFGSYNNGKIDLERSMEEYFAFLPKTQVVVVLPHGTKHLKAEMDRHSEKKQALKSERISTLVFIEEAIKNQLSLLTAAVSAENISDALKHVTLLKEVSASLTSVVNGGDVLTASPLLLEYFRQITQAAQNQNMGAGSFMQNPRPKTSQFGGINSVPPTNPGSSSGDETGNMDSAFM